MTFITPHYWKQTKNKVVSFLNKDYFFVKTPWWLKKLYPNCIWEMPVTDKNKLLYLTFDDGPHPSITPFVMNQLQQFNAKGTFFCIGDNVQKYPHVYEQLLAKGHIVGNHTMYHVNGWKTGTEAYIKDIAAAQPQVNSNLFRPPYGRLTKAQIKGIKQDLNMQIIMWDVLSGDWVSDLSPEKCLHDVLKNIRNGAIVVFHDSEKAWPRLQFVLPKLLKTASELGYTFKGINIPSNELEKRLALH